MVVVCILCRSVFCDFGENFTVFDTNGEPVRDCIVSHITQAEQGVVTVHDEQRHDLEDGEYVTFEEIEVGAWEVCVGGCQCACLRIPVLPFGYPYQRQTEYPANGENHTHFNYHITYHSLMVSHK